MEEVCAVGLDMGKNCDRCGRDCNGVSIMSMYNTEMICASCKAAELKRPDYPAAVAAERDAIRKGNMNFHGIGLRKHP